MELVLLYAACVLLVLLVYIGISVYLVLIDIRYTLTDSWLKAIKQSEESQEQKEKS